MLILDATNKLIEVVLSGAVTTTQLPIVTSFVDITSTSVTPGSSTAQTNDTTDVTAVAAPAASTERHVKYLSIANVDTAQATVTLKYSDAGTDRTIWKGTLSAGDVLYYTESKGLYCLDSSGREKAVSSG